jgi:hypothetical protein
MSSQLSNSKFHAMQGRIELFKILIVPFVFGIALLYCPSAFAQTFDVGRIVSIRPVTDLNEDGAILFPLVVFNSNVGNITLAALTLSEPAYGLPAGRNKLRALDPLKRAVASSVNDFGIVVGVSQNANGEFRPTKWIAGQAIEIETPVNLSLGDILFPTDINNSGVICGGFGLSLGNRQRPFALVGSAFADLTRPDCNSSNPILGNMRINNVGDILGTYS